MDADAPPSGVRAGRGQGAAEPWTSSSAQRPPLPPLFFLFLLLAAPGVQAAGYEVSGARERKRPRAEGKPRVGSGDVGLFCECLVNSC